jgi:hypothetical protein
VERNGKSLFRGHCASAALCDAKLTPDERLAAADAFRKRCDQADERRRLWLEAHGFDARDNKGCGITLARGTTLGCGTSLACGATSACGTFSACSATLACGATLAAHTLDTLTQPKDDVYNIEDDADEDTDEDSSENSDNDAQNLDAQNRVMRWNVVCDWCNRTIQGRGFYHCNNTGLDVHPYCLDDAAFGFKRIHGEKLEFRGWNARRDPYGGTAKYVHEDYTSDDDE